MSSSAGYRLRKLFGSGKTLQLPGAFNGLCGRIAADTGFQALYISGGAISAAHGVPDIGLLSLEHFSAKIREVSVVSGLPIIADADTGFGEAEMVTRIVHEYIHAGAAGLHIEDQAFPKRCGHLDGKELISVDHMTEKIKRARAAADSIDPNFIVCARTDARSVDGFEEAVHRATEYVKAGADMIFPEGLTDISEFKKFSSAMKAGGREPYLLANMTEFGKTEHILLSDFEKAGYHAVIYPVSSLRVAMKAVEDMMHELRTKGTLRDAENDMMTRKRLYEHLQYKPGKEWTYPCAVRK
jgi:methylisocitrate lyase